MITNRTDAWKTDVRLLTLISLRKLETSVLEERKKTESCKGQRQSRNVKNRYEEQEVSFYPCVLHEISVLIELTSKVWMLIFLDFRVRWLILAASSFSPFDLECKSTLRICLTNKVFLSRNYRLIVASQKFDVCPRSEARTSNFQGATIRHCSRSG